MALNNSGPLSFGGATVGQSINLELGLSATAQASINSAAFRTLAGVPSGAISVNNFYGKSNVLPGQQAYTSPATYSWVAPAGVTKVSVVAVGAGAHSNSSGGGGLGYKNNYTVIPGNSYTVVVGAGAICSGGPGQDSYFVSTAVVKGGGGQTQVSFYVGGPGGTYTGDGGGNGGTGGIFGYTGGGGAGGYSGSGGNGGNNNCNGSAGSGGGGGGGGSSGYNAPCGTVGGGRGGGVGLLGQGANGTGGTGRTSYPHLGVAGSGTAGSGGSGTNYGGGGASLYCVCAGGSNPWILNPGQGAVRIIWPGCARAFPSTRTGNE